MVSGFKFNRDVFRFSGSLVAALCLVACGEPMPGETAEVPLKTSSPVAASTGGDVGRSAAGGMNTSCVLAETEYVTHTYEYHRVGYAEGPRTTVKSSGCMFAPVTVQFSSANSGELLAIGANNAVSVLDNDWAPVYDGYQGISTTRTSCGFACLE